MGSRGTITGRLAVSLDTAETQGESEEHIKNDIREFLNKTFLADTYYTNTKFTRDLVIHGGKTQKTPAQVIIETKRAWNTGEMPDRQNINKKALHELVYYYFDERYRLENDSIKYGVITDGYQEG